MNRRTVLILAGLGVALATVLLLGRIDFGSDRGPGELHAPGLGERMGDLESLRVVQAGNDTVATIERRGERGWAVAEKDGHPADFERLRSNLEALAQARRVEKKTALPEFYSRLGVEGPDSPDTDGYLLELDYGERHPAEGYVVGKRAGSGMVYVRTAGEAQSWMVSADFDLSGRARDWLDRDIIDLASGEVRRVALDRGEGDVLEIAKSDSGDINFTPLDIPEGRELSYGSVANSVAGALANVEANDVRSLEFAEQLPRAVLASYDTFDGLAVRLDVREEAPIMAEDGDNDGGAEADPRYWVMFSAAAQQVPTAETDEEAEEAESGASAADAEADGEAEGGESAADAEADGEAESGEGAEEAEADESDGASDATDPEAPSQSPEARAAELNARLGGWAYELPRYKSDQWFKSMDDLLKEE